MLIVYLIELLLLPLLFRELLLSELDVEDGNRDDGKCSYVTMKTFIYCEFTIKQQIAIQEIVTIKQSTAIIYVKQAKAKSMSGSKKSLPFRYEGKVTFYNYQKKEWDTQHISSDEIATWKESFMAVWNYAKQQLAGQLRPDNEAIQKSKADVKDTEN